MELVFGTRPQLKVFSGICTNLVVIWLAAAFVTSDPFILTRDLSLAIVTAYAAVWAEEILEEL